MVWPGFNHMMCYCDDLRDALGRVVGAHTDVNTRIPFQSFSQGRVFEINGTVYVVHLPTNGQDIGEIDYLTGTWRSTTRR